MMKRIRAAAVACALVGISAWTSVGVADSAASAEDIATARALAQEGVKLQEGGDCAGAVEKYQKAEALYHTPSVLTRLGECQIKLGKLVAGTESLQRVVREQLAPNAPPAFVQAQAHAKELLDATLPRLGKLKVHVDAPDGAQLTFKIDGVTVSTASLDTDRAADPGAHVIEISGPGLVATKASVEVAEGKLATLTLKIEREESTTKPPKREPDEAKEPPKKPKHVEPVKGDDEDEDDDEAPRKRRKAPPPTVVSEGPSRVAPIVMFVTAGVGIGLGTVFGLRASGLKGDLDKVCVNKECPASSQGDIDSMKSSATISTIDFGVGIAALAVGTYLWISGSSSESHKTNHAYVEPMIGLGFVGVRGAL